MNVSKYAPIAKTIVAVGGAVVATATCLVDGDLSMADIGIILAAWGTAVGVYHVPNKANRG